MTNMGKWIPIESNPEVFQQYIAKLKGPNNLQVVDLLAFEDWAFDVLPKPVLAVILNFPLTKAMLKRYDDNGELQKKILKPEEALDVWFAKQTVPNACGTMALLHTLMNLRKREDSKYDFDPTGPIAAMYEKMKEKDPDQRAQLLETEKDLEDAHHEMESAGVTAAPDSGEVIGHFSAFLICGSKLYELDGRLDGPICHGPSSEETFLNDTAAVVQSLMKFDPETYDFAALAVCHK
eukprot:Blabericola_migrator_1__714@NODE_1177_length_5203_cov_152_764213_g800_i0_p2_GENE_NODE_1177_length_5203_cov_152_764213_g800_i0NODE_1177_length_5203_cov_152_764213_g800_i0_p2_ORF_typecomplete_len236_score54_95Peptidase_C12/PF01088_21/2_3e51_NODE_1177_length_5203_cov_152_764213_g800_i04301137